MIDNLEIRICREEDIAPLEKTIPTGANRYHSRRFTNQEKGESTYLLAFLHDEPVGHLDLIWDPSSSQEASVKQPNACPELNAIEVIPGLRSQGIGSQLIAFAEGLIAQRGYRKVCLGVAINNPRAKSLYEKLGYQDSGQGIIEDCFVWIDDKGCPIDIREPIVCLVKTLDF